MKKLTRSIGRATAFLILMCFVLLQACKKDLLLQKKPPKSDAEIQKITLSDFKQSVNLDKLGFLKQKFASGSGKIMSIGDGIGFELSVNTDAVQKLITKDGVSYIFSMPLISPRAVEFSNLTIEVKGDKTIAFITTFTPTKAWNEAYKKKHIIAFEGDITFIPVSLETLNLTEALSSFKASPGEKIMSAPNKVMNTRACTTYYLYDYVPYGCSSGNHMPDDPNCIWNDPFASVPAGEYRAGYHVIPKSYQICEDGVQSPVGSSGGGGGADGDTSPYTPGNYNPCDEPPLDGSTKKKNTPCDESPSPDVIEQVMASALISKMLEINDNQRLQFINDPANATIVNDLLAYVGANGKTAEVIDFLNWSIRYLIENPGSFNQAFRDLLNGVYNEYSPIYIPNNFDIAYPQDYFDTEDSYDALTLELVQEGISNTDPIPEAYYKNGTKIDMSLATPLNGRKTALGFPSNHRYFWRELIKLRPEMFDEKNRAVILAGGSPVANDQWIKYNPTHRAYKDLPLRHHHEGQGRWAYAIPEKVHQKWSKILHSIKAGKFPKLKGTMNALAGGMQIFSLLTDFNTGNPDAWLNWYGPVDQVGKVYKQPFSGDYFVITKQTKYMNSSGEVIRAKVTYDVFADYIWDADEQKYMGVLKLGTFTELVDMNNRWSSDQVWEPKKML